MTKNTMFQTAEIGFEVLDFLGLRFILASVCFEFRASDFGFEVDGFVSVRGASFVLRISCFEFFVGGAFAA